MRFFEGFVMVEAAGIEPPLVHESPFRLSENIAYSCAFSDVSFTVKF